MEGFWLKMKICFLLLSSMNICQMKGWKTWCHWTRKGQRDLYESIYVLIPEQSVCVGGYFEVSLTNISLASGPLHISLPGKFPLLLLLHLLIPTYVFCSKSLSPRSFYSTDLSLNKVSLIWVPIALYTFPTIIHIKLYCNFLFEFPTRQ